MTFGIAQIKFPLEKWNTESQKTFRGSECNSLYDERIILISIEHIFIFVWFNPHSNPLRSLLLTSFFRWRKWGSERWANFLPAPSCRAGQFKCRPVRTFSRWVRATFWERAYILPRREHSFWAFQYILFLSLSTSSSPPKHNFPRGWDPAANTRCHQDGCRQDLEASPAVLLLRLGKEPPFHGQGPGPGGAVPPDTVSTVPSETAAIAMGIRGFPELCSLHCLRTRNYCSRRNRGCFSLGIWAWIRIRISTPPFVKMGDFLNLFYVFGLWGVCVFQTQTTVPNNCSSYNVS